MFRICIGNQEERNKGDDLITPNKKIDVFISSKCGEQKYDLVRAGLKALIDCTGLAVAYVFESSQASSLTAERHFTYELQDCDVCIFLIDNKDGIPNGVIKEIEVANKHNITSIYYFCDEYSKEKTPLQKSFGHQSPLVRTVSSFTELLNQPAKGFIDDIVRVYKLYGKGRLIFSNEEVSRNDTLAIQEKNFFLDAPISKSIISTIDKCKDYFYQLIFQQSKKDTLFQQDKSVENTSLLDTYCHKFLPVIFENKSVLDYNPSVLLQELKNIHSDDYYAVVEKRWYAIQAYYQGQTSSCIGFLNEALRAAKSSSLPEWVVLDILIDLRNITSAHESGQSTFSMGGEAQKELDNSSGVLHYPVIDRFNSSLYEKCIQDEIKEKIKSPHSVTIGHDVTLYADLLASKFVVACINGSLTQLLILFDQIRKLSYHLVSRFSGWHFRLLMLETTLVDGKSRDTDGVIRRYDDILCKMNAADAKKVYDFSCNRPIEYQRFISNLETFRVVGYFLGDDDFDLIWNDLKRRIAEWLASETPNVYVEQVIFPALSGNIHRIDANEIADICCKTIENGWARFYDDVFKVLAEPIELSSLSQEMMKRLLDNVISIVSRENERRMIIPLEGVLCVFRKKYKDITESLDDAVKQHMPQFYADTYALETSANDSNDMQTFLQKYIEVAEEIEKTQGKGGVYSGYANNPFRTIGNIIENSTVPFDFSLLSSAFRVTAETLLNTVHSISDKSSAMKLIISLSRKHKEILQSNHDLVVKLQSNKDLVTSGTDHLTNLSNISLRLSSLFMFSCFGEGIWLPLMEVLADIKDDEPSLIHASATISHFLEQSVSGELETELVAVLLQYSLRWCREDNKDVRWNAICSLLTLVDDARCSAVVCNQLVKSLDTDNVYIKNRISWYIDKIKNVDEATYAIFFKRHLWILIMWCANGIQKQDVKARDKFPEHMPRLRRQSDEGTQQCD